MPYHTKKLSDKEEAQAQHIANGIMRTNGCIQTGTLTYRDDILPYLNYSPDDLREEVEPELQRQHIQALQKLQMSKLDIAVQSGNPDDIVAALGRNNSISEAEMGGLTSRCFINEDGQIMRQKLLPYCRGAIVAAKNAKRIKAVSLTGSAAAFGSAGFFGTQTGANALTTALGTGVTSSKVSVAMSTPVFQGVMSATAASVLSVAVAGLYAGAALFVACKLWDQGHTKTALAVAGGNALSVGIYTALIVATGLTGWGLAVLAVAAVATAIAYYKSEPKTEQNAEPSALMDSNDNASSYIDSWDRPSL